MELLGWCLQGLCSLCHLSHPWKSNYCIKTGQETNISPHSCPASELQLRLLCVVGQWWCRSWWLRPLSQDKVNISPDEKW